MARVIGIGLVALDVVTDERDRRISAAAGGSCGNVMAILAWLGWGAVPVARLDTDDGGLAVREDLLRCGVDLRWISVGTPTPTPMFVERLHRGPDGSVQHRFDRFCPGCGQPLARYQPVTRAALADILDNLEGTDIVYIDRPSPGAVTLAEHAVDRGIRVVFEPSARGKTAHMASLAAAASIVKYSADRLSLEDRRIIAEARPVLEVETLGARGLRYRTGETWRTLSAPAVEVRDTAGAGDWTTAALLHALRLRATSLERLSRTALRDVLTEAQAMGSWSCGFVGPRGAMEHCEPAQALAGATALARGDRHAARRRVASAGETAWTCARCP